MPGKKLSYFERALSTRSRARRLIFAFPLEFFKSVFFVIFLMHSEEKNRLL
jgi:hypothetical protein